jgi:ABC-2 type transport system ATP-binding protein
VVGFLGPNGAGKSTTMKVLTGYLSPTEGAIAFEGVDAYSAGPEIRNRIGYLPETNALYPDLVVLDFLRYVADLRGIPSAKAIPRIREVGARCGIESVIGKEIGHLSKGFKQRVGLAQALLHDPPILILDEPTSGLDPNQIVEIRELIRELGQDHTLILSTHNLHEVMQVCSRLLIIHKGELVADGTAEEIQTREAHGAEVVLELQKNGSAPESVRQLLQDTLAVTDVLHETTAHGELFRIRGQADVDFRPDVFRLASQSNWPLIELHRNVLDLEGIFHQLTRD